MKVTIEKKICNGCTICNITCPEVFTIEDDGKAGTCVSVVPKKIEQICVEAADECPASAIVIEFGSAKEILKEPVLAHSYR